MQYAIQDYDILNIQLIDSKMIFSDVFDRCGHIRSTLDTKWQQTYFIVTTSVQRWTWSTVSVEHFEPAYRSNQP